VDYPRAMQVIQELENAYDVHALTYRGVCVWPYLRNMAWRSMYYQIIGSDLSISQPLSAREEVPSKNHAEFNLEQFGPTPWQMLVKEKSHLSIENPEIIFHCRVEDYSEVHKGQAYHRIFDPLYDKFASRYSILKVHLLSRRLLDLNFAHPGAYLYLENLMKVKGGQEKSQIANLNLFYEMMSGYNIPALPSEHLHLEIEAAFQLVAPLAYIFKATGCKAVFSTCFYSAEGFAISLASRLAGIISVDVQHGRVNEYEIPMTGFSKMPASGYDILPHFFWSWSDEAAAIMRKGRPKESSDFGNRTVVGGHPTIWKWLEDGGTELDSDTERLEKQMDSAEKVVLVTLQDFPNPLPDSLIDAIENSPSGWLWLIRCHYRFRVDIPAVENLLMMRGLSQRTEVCRSTNAPIFWLLSKVDHHVTLWSSTVYEALVFGLSSTVIHEEGLKNFHSEIERGLFDFACTAETILESVKTNLGKGKGEGNTQYAEYRSQILAAAMDEILQFHSRAV